MYITASYLINAVNPKFTSQPNFSDDPNNYMADEVVSITRKIRDSDLKKCNVILDVKNKVVVKCRDFQLDGKVVKEPNFDKLMEHFQEMYPTQIAKLLEIVNTQ